MLLTGNTSKAIVHMDLDAFFVSVSCLLHPELKGKPVIIGGNSERGVVAACSYEARKFGIHSAMPTKMVKRLCPDAVFFRGDYNQYSKYSDIVTQIIKERVPLYEKSSIDEFYIDMTGMDQFFGCYKYATELRQRIIRETGLPISFGMSKNKTVSKIATDEAKPNNQMKIDFGTEKDFLAPLSVKKIPMVGEKTYQLLRSMGVEKVKTVQDMPVELMQHVLGDSGTVIWRKANGIDNSPVEPYNERKSISTEETFEQDTIDVAKLKSILIKMTEKIAYQLRSENKLTACITVKIRYSNFDTHTMQARISYTSCDHTLIQKVKELFDKVYNRRMLIRLIGVKFSHLVGGGYQINLFEDSEEIINLYQAMDRMRRVYGAQAIGRAAGVTKSLRMFNPFNGISTSPSGTEAKDAAAKEYVLSIRLPAYISKEIVRLKNDFNKTYEHVQTEKSSPQIMLIKFMQREEKEEEMLHAISEVCAQHQPVEVRLKNFITPDNGIYINVANPSSIVKLLKSLDAKLNLQRSQSHYAWHPHITIAQALTAEKFEKAKPEFEKTEYASSFITDSVQLMKRDSTHDHFLLMHEFEFGCMERV